MCLLIGTVSHVSDVAHGPHMLRFTEVIFFFNLIAFFKKGHSCTMKDFHIHTRIICITDGRPTDFTSTSSCDDYPQIETENVTKPFFSKQYT